MPRKPAILFALSLWAGFGCASQQAVVEPLPTTPTSTTATMVWPEMPEIPAPVALREFRAAWIATVDNIDWPGERGLTPEVQQEEMRVILDQARRLGLNAVIFQVRPMADALYASSLEPWSIYLTGEPGQSPGYDPLEFAIQEAHARGIEVHAWLNPFRARHPTHEVSLDPTHVGVRNPEWVHAYGRQLWLDPGHPEAREHSLRVMLDVVERYDVDGVHMDDYFYPYPASDSTGAPVPFPDDASWAAAGRPGTRADWRRANVDSFVEDLYRAVKAFRPRVKVGISPFGIWRPGFPEGIVGFDQYEGLYADARRWLVEGWVDYMTPQLYWALDSQGQPYAPLLDWWIDQNQQGRHVWPGNFTSRVILEGGARWDPDELVRQVQHTRKTAGATGNVHFSMRALMPGPGADVMLLDSVYAEPALIPETDWLGGDRPGAPAVNLDSDRMTLSPRGGDDPFVWHIREYRNGRWTLRLESGDVRLVDYGGAGGDGGADSHGGAGSDGEAGSGGQAGGDGEARSDGEAGGDGGAGSYSEARVHGAPTHVVVSAVSRLGREGPASWGIRQVPAPIAE